MKKAKSKVRAGAADRRERFCIEYVKDFNATQAVIRAGYSRKTARQQGSRLLTDAVVQRRLTELRTIIAEQAGLTVERVARRIEVGIFGDIRKLYDESGALRPVHTLDEETAWLVGGIETEEVYDAEAYRKAARKAGQGEMFDDDGKPTASAEATQVTVTRKVKLRSAERFTEMGMAYLGMHKSIKPGEGAFNLTISTSDGKSAR